MQREHVERYVAFAAAVGKRLEAGAREYGGRSFSEDPIKLVEEVRQELRDVAGWAFVLDTRLAAIAEALKGNRP